MLPTILYTKSSSSYNMGGRGRQGMSVEKQQMYDIFLLLSLPLMCAVSVLYIFFLAFDSLILVVFLRNLCSNNNGANSAHFLCFIFPFFLSCSISSCLEIALPFSPCLARSLPFPAFSLSLSHSLPPLSISLSLSFPSFRRLPFSTHRNLGIWTY